MVEHELYADSITLMWLQGDTGTWFKGSPV